MDFRLLGPLEVFDGARAVEIGGGKRRSLLALLLLHGNEVVSADRLIDGLWGESPPPTAAKGLQVYVSQLRKELQNGADRDGDVLVTRANGYVLQLGPDEVDVQRFERSVSAGERALAAGEPDRAAQRLRQGLALWRGPPLADFTYEPFAQQEIARLDELRLVALEQRIDADLALGRHAQVVGELEALVREHPLRERIRGQLMLALYRCGRQAEALEAYRDGRRQHERRARARAGPGAARAGGQDPRPQPRARAPAAPRRRAPRERDERPEGRAPRRRRLHPALAIVAAAVLLGGAALAAALRSGDDAAAGAASPWTWPRTRSWRSAPAVADPRSPSPSPAAPRAWPLRAAGSSSPRRLRHAHHRRRPHAQDRARRTASRFTPAAVAAAGNRVWVADRRRGVVVGFEAGYERPTRPDRLPAGAGDRTRGAQRPRVGLRGQRRRRRVGDRRLAAPDPDRRAVRRGRAVPRRAHARRRGQRRGAVWAFSSKTATVVRIDPRTGAITDSIRIATRRGSDKPYPVGIATTPGTVWVLNGNTATVTRIDAAQGGVRDTVAIGMDRLPRGIGASGGTVWVANFDGSVSRIAPGRGTPSSIWIGESLGAVVAEGDRVWVTTTALDQQLPGGNG